MHYEQTIFLEKAKTKKQNKQTSVMDLFALKSSSLKKKKAIDLLTDIREKKRD